MNRMKKSENLKEDEALGSEEGQGANLRDGWISRVTKAAKPQFLVFSF